MKALSDCKLCRALTEKGKKLAQLQLRGKYQMELGLYGDENTQSPSCSHTCDGSLAHPLWEIVAVLGAVALAMALLHAVCGLFSRLSH
ncbi:MAG: hypothetical protein IJY47_05930 [Clostridia bacterium]|nr:hypothetical protein [Clostridia bacterium]